METQRIPRIELAQKVLPAPMLTALNHVFAQGLDETILVGGTALAGFYAGHRKPQDLRLFAKSPLPQKATVMAVQSLTEIGASFSDAKHTENSFHADCQLEGHRFVVDVALNQDLFKSGGAGEVNCGVSVATLDTLLRDKVAALVTQVSEQDLYDLKWLQQVLNLPVERLITEGATVNSKVTPEAILIELTGMQPQLENCDFGLPGGATVKEIFEAVVSFKMNLEGDLLHIMQNQPTPLLGQALYQLRQGRR